MEEKSGRQRNYRFTFNNYKPEDEERLLELVPKPLKYIIYGHEIAPTTGTPHLQGFCAFENAVAFHIAIDKLKGAHVMTCQA